MRIALQMDPIETINIDGDSSFLLGIGAQERGHQLFYYQPRDLFWEAGEKGRLMAGAQSVVLRREKGNHATLGTKADRALAEAFDCILLRQDPPFHMGYLTTTYFLEQVKHSVRVLNDPTGVRNAPEKMLITQFAHFMPPTLVSSDIPRLAGFMEKHRKVVAKKIYGHGGRDVYLFDNDLSGLTAFAESHWNATGEPIMLQGFLPEIAEGDKRIILYDGVPVAAMRRVPQKGQFLANLAQGGSAVTCELSPRDREICAAIGPTLKAMGLYFVGLDVIGDYLIEINVTSPTGLAAINRLYGLEDDARMEMLFWKGLGY